ncbi:glutamate-1-semialdehyde 2,1-aminomutase [Lachnoclostridium phytofermentans]|uniref:Glutamate-1-semialdehyde 2,1-aminomutase 1 n=1 Tax=Lachnoclostridium phytofermentans (strain ATCC 700394 / DSM 18823 / ISDg) TaxID=357809 RepID=GSA1_LACP7|nr:glutamate-1-semialdehyde 2,1-aminomutase [Lachnoclostridium phytofermentans]A9KP86.1 RecName: Full=Glutamate-1-semialdehyde 2,1-aminomutase 1; Short=GSA 1; AltName: Full=Glutamate-1-semialdehyde aminotransferase 1; Short=GSA-AT 1 [Lachnoclostridium phytofermentans ISDg]ABX41748.1 glutamate-1-semialdehyde-2,1-aminomutase [Lachnoclostridium phytofermentans ISDg]
MTRSEELFKEALKVIPGGVNSPVRAFGSVGESPRFIKRAEGAHLYDVDGKEYIDYICSWGPMILGHNHPDILESVVQACQNGLSFGAVTEMEVKMAKLICELVPSIEMVRMVNSGTEAVMSAIRVARGYTGRNKIIKFNGCYHGHSDGLLVKAGSGVMTAGVPDSLGVPKGCTEDTLTANYNDITGVQELFNQYRSDIAAVIVEPVAANMGVVLPKEGFLHGLRKLCNENGTVLIFDEVITGFRLGIDGAQGYYGVTPDLTTYGKIIGAGMPVGAYGGRKEIMEVVAPLGAVYQAGTLSGNPVAMTAGYTQLTILKENPDYYTKLNQMGELLFGDIEMKFRRAGIPFQMNHVGSLGSLFFAKEEVYDYQSAKASDTEQYKAYFKYMLNKGIYLAPAQFEAMFLSVAHGEEEIKQTLDTMDGFLESVR